MLVLSVVALVPLAMGRTASGQVDARQVYLRDCASCHGADGRGTERGPTLEGQGAAGVDFMLSTGRMPLKGGADDVERHPPAYDRATIDALVQYVSTLVPGGPAIPNVDAAAGDLTDGGTEYRAQCAACHQTALQGGALVRGSSPDLEQATAVQVGEAMRTGPGAMPVFGSAAASDHDVEGIARYVLTLPAP